MQLFAGIRTFRYSRKSLPSVREITRSNGSQSETNAASLPSGDMAPIPPRRSLTLTTSRREKTAARIDLFWTVTSDSPIRPCSWASSVRTDRLCHAQKYKKDGRAHVNLQPPD